MKAKASNFIALDLGSSKIAAVACYIDKAGDIRVFGQHLSYSEGLKSGIITNLKSAENSIIGAIYKIEKDCGKSIKQVTISLPGAGTKSYYVKHKIKISNQQILKQDVKKLIQKALSEFKFNDREIIHYFPIEFIVDGNNSVENPIGMFARELECQLHIITADSSLLMNIVNCFAKYQIEVTNVLLGAYATGIACLSDDERNLGSVIIDLGSRTTSFGIFLYNKLIYSGYIPIGSWHITYDIAKIFSISFSAAEKLKVLYGNAMPSSFDRDGSINIEDFEPDHQYDTIPNITASNLAEVIHSRLEEILLTIKEQYDKTALDRLIARRLVISGGGSTLRGVKELASKIFEKQVRIGKPTILPGFAEDHNPNAYASVVGAVKDQAQKQQKHFFEIGIEEDDNIIKKALVWLKENI